MENSQEAADIYRDCSMLVPYYPVSPNESANLLSWFDKHQTMKIFFLIFPPPQFCGLFVYNHTNLQDHYLLQNFAALEWYVLSNRLK